LDEILEASPMAGAATLNPEVNSSSLYHDLSGKQDIFAGRQAALFKEIGKAE
jgi:hypothetical protein